MPECTSLHKPAAAESLSLPHLTELSLHCSSRQTQLLGPPRASLQARVAQPQVGIFCRPWERALWRSAAPWPLPRRHPPARATRNVSGPSQISWGEQSHPGREPWGPACVHAAFPFESSLQPSVLILPLLPVRQSLFRPPTSNVSTPSGVRSLLGAPTTRHQ